MHSLFVAPANTIETPKRSKLRPKRGAAKDDDRGADRGDGDDEGGDSDTGGGGSSDGDGPSRRSGGGAYGRSLLGGDGLSGDSGVGSKRKRSDLIPPLDVSLSTSDALVSCSRFVPLFLALVSPPALTLTRRSTPSQRDIRTIDRDHKIHAKQFQAYAMQNGGIIVPKTVAITPGELGSGAAGTKLVVDESVFIAGESVVVTVGFTMEEYAGTLVSIGQRELLLRLGDGTEIRVLVDHLRNGRCALRKA